MLMVFTKLCICISKYLEFILKVGIYCQGDEKERDRTSDICTDSGLFGLFIAYVSTKEKGVQRTKNIQALGSHVYVSADRLMNASESTSSKELGFLIRDSGKIAPVTYRPMQLKNREDR